MYEKSFFSLKNLEGNSVADIIYNFSGEIPNYNLKFGTEQGASNTLSQVAAIQPFIDVNNYITIFFNTDPDVINNVTDLAVATTILHEAIHAHLVISAINDPTTTSLLYPDLFTKHGKFKTGYNSGTVQHNIFVQNFIKDIAITVEQYGKAQGYKLDSSYYEALSWKGLTDTKAFKALSIEEQNRIKDIHKSEQYGITTQSVNQQGKKLGC